MPRLDHLGLFVPDGPAAASALQAMGFTLTPIAHQTTTDPSTGAAIPAGTANFCVMFEEGYLELLFATGDTEAGRTVAAEAAQRAGLHLLSLTTENAEAFDGSRRAEGWEMRPLARFARDVETETAPITARFTLARPGKGLFPEGRVQVMTHHSPEALWQPRWLTHANGATALKALLVATPTAEEAARRLARFAGAEATPQGTHWHVPLARGHVEFWPLSEASALLSAPVDSAHFFGLRLTAPDEKHLPFPPALGKGVMIFEP